MTSLTSTEESCIVFFIVAIALVIVIRFNP